MGKKKMPKVIFKFDKEKDLWNNWDTVNYKSPWEKGVKFNKMPILDEICKDKKFEECKDEIEKFWVKVHNSFLIEEIRIAFQNAWDKINDEFFKRLEKITGNKFPFDEATVYLTTQGRCPYNFTKGYFFCSLFSNIPNSLITGGHELMHFDFHNYDWKTIEKKIGKDKTADLKEALTVLLNLEFNDLWFIEDKGKPSEGQKKLRDFIKNEWTKEKNYKSLLDKCVIYAKEKETQ